MTFCACEWGLVSYKTPWDLIGAWEGNLVGAKYLWHLVLANEGSLKDSRVLGVQVSLGVVGAYDGVLKIAYKLNKLVVIMKLRKPV